ncbi:dihydroneopterin aldolase [Corynebacterium mendelii]|uniref:7,8-dihydroneopterin aldolase n=1 Tax=Corynebacterium mendelii TaxID=2765362 RepID=A0A939E3N6_9CORY|nr:dihydroneopterin aldolase [Corynebacterium mendelii]MBN9645091.1 dihydroneopterin aldolase [Corynebacterium mendelii]
MADRIEITGLHFTACHGVLEEEKTTPQPFVVDIRLWLDCAPAAATDDIAATVSYADVAGIAEKIVSAQPVNLIETVAARIADDVLATYQMLHAVEVTVHKPQAPLPQRFDDVAVVARRSRPRRGPGRAGE